MPQYPRGMRFEKRLRDGIEDGSITVAFRRWNRRQVVAGNRYRTGTGMVQMDAVDLVDPAAVTMADAGRAGYGSVDALFADLPGATGVPLYRLRFHKLAGPDPRDLLAADSGLSDQDVAHLRHRLERIDRLSSQGPWTAAVLETIAAHPGVRAADLAESLGWEVLPFKVNVRKLKSLGLTISLEVGYRLSPRGRAYLAATSANPRARGTGSRRR
jgi:hypothetical protein